jgi:gamma-glutamylputrescine oxidase
MSVSYWQNNLAQKPVQEADIVIIGGGIAGFSTAYWLKKEDPQLKIVILEKHEIGEGATGRNAGFITCGSVEHFNRIVGKHGIIEASAIWKFSEDNLKLLQEHIIQDQDTLIDFKKQGSFSLASTESEIKELKKTASLMESLNIPVEVLNESQVQKRLGAEKFVGGIKYLEDASVHPLKLLSLLRQKLETGFKDSAPIQIFENSEVFALETESSQKLVRSKKGDFKSSLVVLATNGYSSLLDPYFNSKIFPTRGQILATEPVPLFMEGPCYANFVLDYFRQLSTGEMIIGGFRQLQKDSEVGFSDQTTEVIQSALEQFLQTHIPHVRKAAITHRWSGIMGFSVDGQPMVGSLPHDPQTYFVGGFTGHGLGLAFHSAKSLVDLLYDRPIPNFLSAKRWQAT